MTEASSFTSVYMVDAPQILVELDGTYANVYIGQ